jgi:hypothetical protein
MLSLLEATSNSIILGSVALAAVVYAKDIEALAALVAGVKYGDGELIRSDAAGFEMERTTGTVTAPWVGVVSTVIVAG